MAGISELEGRDESGNETVVMGDEINVRMGSQWSNMRNVLQNGKGWRLWHWMEVGRLMRDGTGGNFPVPTRAPIWTR